MPKLELWCCTTAFKMANHEGELDKQKQVKQNLLPQGARGERGRSIYYDEVKSRSYFMLTPTAKEVLDELAAKQGLSNSEALERLLRTIGGKPFET